MIINNYSVIQHFIYDYKLLKKNVDSSKVLQIKPRDFDLLPLEKLQHRFDAFLHDHEQSTQPPDLLKYLEMDSDQLEIHKHEK